MISQIGKPTGIPPNLLNLPVELQELIFQHLPQSALLELILTNRSLVNITASYLFAAPHFASCYRYAQFAHLVSRKPHYADLVRVLDLSYFAKENLDEGGNFLPMAGWREFKYRDSDDCSIPQATRGRGGRCCNTHPAPSPFLKTFNHTRDIPFGGLAHVLAACKNIRSINVSNLQLASDFILSPAGSPSPEPHDPSSPSPDPTTGLTFVSDVPKAWIWKHRGLKAVYADYIINFFLSLDHLESLTATSVSWIDTARVERLCGPLGPRSLKWVDFTGCEMGWTQTRCREWMVDWMVKDSRANVWRILERNVGVRGGRCEGLEYSSGVVLCDVRS